MMVFNNTINPLGLENPLLSNFFNGNNQNILPETNFVISENGIKIKSEINQNITIEIE